MMKSTFAAAALAGLAALLAMTERATAQMTDVTELTATEAAAAIRDGKITSRQLVDALIAQAEAGAGLNAFILLDAKGARAAADLADVAVKAGAATGPLHGVPIVAKDNINSAGLATTAGTEALKGFVPAEHAPVLQKLTDAGAILLGKTNMHELAFGITSNNAAFGAVGNAYAADRFAGGSSGGSGTAVGARMAPAALGTDTGGSVRIPAALNGIAGLRPTMGRYPGEGIVPISHTRDTAGPMARSIEDLVLLDTIITGDSDPVEPAALGGVTLARPAQFVDDLDAETKRLFDAAIARLEAGGATIVDIDIADIVDLAGKAGFPIALVEVKDDLDAFVKKHGAAEGIEAVAAQVKSPDVKFVMDNLVLGDEAPPRAVYEDVMTTVRPALIAAYEKALADSGADALVFPTTPLPAQPIEGSDMTVMLNGREVPTFQTVIRNTDPGSNAGIPGLTIPIGLTRDGLPVGLELDGLAGSDRTLLGIGLAVEAVAEPTPAPK